MRGLTAELSARGMKSDRCAVWVFLLAEGLSFKKTMLPAEQSWVDIAAKRRRWKAHQGRIGPRRLVFIDGSRHCLERGEDQHGNFAWLGAAWTAA